MTEQGRLSASQDEQVGGAVHAATVMLQSLPETDRDAIMVGILRAVYAYRHDGKEDGLVRMADDVAMTVGLRSSQNYRELRENGPVGPTGKGRPVAEVFAELAQ